MHLLSLIATPKLFCTVFMLIFFFKSSKTQGLAQLGNNSVKGCSAGPFSHVSAQVNSMWGKWKC